MRKPYRRSLPLLVMTIPVVGMGLYRLQQSRAPQSDEDKYFKNVKLFVEHALNYQDGDEVPRHHLTELFAAAKHKDVNRCAQSLLEVLGTSQGSLFEQAWLLYSQAAMLETFNDPSSEALPPLTT